MDVILLERVAKLGQIGEKVRVKDGYARNFLLPRGKALRATEANNKKFEAQRAHLEARNLELKTLAQGVAEKMSDHNITIIRQAGQTGMLYGSVTAKDLADALVVDGYTVTRQHVVLNAPLKNLGVYTVPVQLHPEVEITIQVNVARSIEEAEKQLRGEQLNMRESINMDDLGLDVGAALAEAGDVEM
jgi:large subunit ribosomal protein L9